MIRVLIAEDQHLVRGALLTLLDLEDDLEVVAEAATFDEIARRGQQFHPDVALLDIELPGGNGIDAIEPLRQVAPGCKVLIVTTFNRPGYLQRALEAGALGYVLKHADADTLADSIRKVAAGRRVVDSDFAAEALATAQNPLTERECEVLRAADDGATAERIAEELFLSPGTVRNHISTVIQKLGVSNRAEALRTAREQGWL